MGTYCIKIPRDNMESSVVLFFISLLGVSLTSAQTICNLPFEEIGGRCLYVDPFESGSWHVMRLFCTKLSAGSDLVVINDANLLRAIIDYISEFGLDHTNYWTAATDVDHENIWTYPDGSDVPMGAPIWRYDCDGNFTQRPLYDLDANCAALDKTAHHLMVDFNCLGDGGEIPFSPICQAPPLPTTSSAATTATPASATMSATTFMFTATTP